MSEQRISPDVDADVLQLSFRAGPTVFTRAMWIVGGLGLLMVYLLIFVGGGVSASVLPVLLGFPALMIVGGSLAALRQSF